MANARTANQTAALRTALRDTELRARDLVLPIVNGSLALGSAVGLAAVAAWLIARAAEMPSPADIALAAVIVRTFGISRGLFRYLERLASHRTALSGVVALRERLYTRLAAARADTVLSLPRGDIVARMGADLDAVGDAVVRAIIPVGVAITVSAVAVGIVVSQLPVAGAALALCLVLAGVVPAVLTWRSARIAAQLGLRAHAHVSEATLSALESAPEHRVWGTTRQAQGNLRQANREAEDAHEAAA
ncbi:MAG: ABC transporter transmembrane domain-containing protein, partial [Demequina sp.]